MTDKEEPDKGVPKEFHDVYSLVQNNKAQKYELWLVSARKSGAITLYSHAFL